MKFRRGHRPGLLPVAAVTLAVVGLGAGCMKPAAPLVEERNATATVHTYGHTSTSFTPKRSTREVLRASCNGNGHMTVEVNTGSGTASTTIACPGDFEEAGPDEVARQPVTLKVTSDDKSIDGWAQLVPAQS